MGMSSSTGTYRLPLYAATFATFGRVKITSKRHNLPAPVLHLPTFFSQFIIVLPATNPPDKQVNLPA